MADAFDVVLPTPGQRPWNLNPAIEEIRGRVSETDDVIETGRLSDSELSAKIGEVAEPVVAAGLAADVSATKVLRIGVNTDSLGFGTGTTSPGVNGATGWPARMAAHLTSLLGLVAGGAGTTITVQVRNHSVGGSYSGSSFNRMTTDLLADAPHIALIMGTPNDTRIDAGNADLKNYAVNLRKQIGLCRVIGVTPVLVTPAPIDGTMYNPAGVYDATSETKRLAMCVAIRALATELGVMLIDVDKALSSSPEFPQLYSADGIHPGNTGADMIGSIIARGLAAQAPLALLWHLVASDNFNRADSTTSMGGGSVTYTVLGGTGGITANKAYSQGPNPLRAVVDADNADHEVEAIVTPLNNVIQGAILRVIDATNFIIAAWWPGGSPTVRLYKRVAGTDTLLVSSAALPALTVGTPFTLRARVDGAVLTVFVNGVQVVTHTLSGGDMAVFGTQELAGVFINGTGTTTAGNFDDLRVRSEPV